MRLKKFCELFYYDHYQPKIRTQIRNEMSILLLFSYQYCVINRYGMEFFKCIQINGRTFPLIL